MRRRTVPKRKLPPLSELPSWADIEEEIEEQLAYIYEFGVLCGPYRSRKTEEELQKAFIQLVADKLPFCLMGDLNELSKCAKKVLESYDRRKQGDKAHRECTKRMKTKE
jgi:hypothetical protein